MGIRNSVSPIHYRLNNTTASNVIELDKAYLANDGFIDVAVIGKFAYVNFRGLMLKGESNKYECSFKLYGLHLFNSNSWIDVVMSKSKQVSDCGLLENNYGCYMHTMKTTSSDVRLSGFALFELA